MCKKELLPDSEVCNEKSCIYIQRFAIHGRWSAFLLREFSIAMSHFARGFSNLPRNRHAKFRARVPRSPGHTRACCVEVTIYHMCQIGCILVTWPPKTQMCDYPTATSLLDLSSLVVYLWFLNVSRSKTSHGSVTPCYGPIGRVAFSFLRWRWSRCWFTCSIPWSLSRRGINPMSRHARDVEVQNTLSGHQV